MNQDAGSTTKSWTISIRDRIMSRKKTLNLFVRRKHVKENFKR
jgi:hypothetical protein